MSLYAMSDDPNPPRAFHCHVSQDQEKPPIQSEQPKLSQKQILRPSIQHKLGRDEASAATTGSYEGRSIADVHSHAGQESGLIRKQKITREPKPDNDVSETTRKRRAATEKKAGEKRRMKEVQERRIEHLQKNGIERPEGPCESCKDRGTICKISIDSSSRSSKCLCCLQSTRMCNFPDLRAAVPETIVTSKERKLPNRQSHQVYSLPWYRGLSKSEKSKVLVELIKSNNRYLKSGTLRLPGPCRPCFVLNLECWVIKEGSVASQLSESKRCSNCLDDTISHSMRSQLKGPLRCSDDQEESVPRQVCVSIAIPGANRHSQRFHRKLFPDIFAVDDPVRLMPSALNDDTKLARELYQFIEHLSLQVDMFHVTRSSSPLPFSPANILRLLKLSPEDTSLPTVAKAIEQGLGIEGGLKPTEFSEKICQLELDGCSLFGTPHGYFSPPTRPDNGHECILSR